MTDKPFDKFRGRDGFFHIGIIFMPIVMEGNIFPIIFINAGSSDHRPAKISANIFDNSFGVAFIGFGINIKAMFVILITECFRFFERRTGFGFQFIKECSAECIT